VRVAWARVGAWAVPVAVVLALFSRFAHLGFPATDDGMLLAQTLRVLRGEVPHLDIVFARPLGSAYLHIVDFLLPMPLFEASRLTGIAAIVAYSYLLAWLTYGRAPVKWGLGHHFGAIAAALVNLHTFPSMAWYTTDGLVFASLGFVLVQRALAREVPGVPVGGMLMLGIAVLMKQSYLLAPVIGVGWLLLRWWGSDARWRLAGRAAAWGACPALMYLGLAATVGALPELIRQIGGASPVWGRQLVLAIIHPQVVMWVAGTVGLMAAASWYGSQRTERQPEDDEARGYLIAGDAVSRLGLTVLVLYLPLAGRFEYTGDWGLVLTWMLVAQVAFLGSRGRVDAEGVILVAIAWMASLSWGYAVPNLVAGSVGLAVIHRAWQGFAPPRRHAPALRVGVSLAAAAVTLGFAFGLIRAREEQPYRDLPVREMTAELREVSPRFGSIRTNPITALHLTQVVDCIERFPASRVAVLPDHAAVYPALGLHNPFPMDWMYVNDTYGQEERIIAAAEALDARGDYLVLFQTLPVWPLPTLDELQEGTVGARLFTYVQELSDGIFRALSGEEIVCGTFIGRYKR
jgi:hypothetical protein